jgi:hypothetical protein
MTDQHRPRQPFRILSLHAPQDDALDRPDTLVPLYHAGRFVGVIRRRRGRTRLVVQRRLRAAGGAA